MSLSKYLLAIDIGGTKIADALLPMSPRTWRDLHREQIHKQPTYAHRGGPSLIRTLRQLITKYRDNTPLAGVAISTAGVVDPDSGAITDATALIPHWAGTPLRDLLEHDTGLRVTVINDAHAHGLGEALSGAGIGYDRQLMFAVGTGVGGAYISHGTIEAGAHGITGYFGHTLSPLAADMPCTCGKTGHLEAVASGLGQAALYDRYAKNAGIAAKMDNGREVEEAARAGDHIAQRVLFDSGYALGGSIASLANALDPDAVLLSGSVIRPHGIYHRGLMAGVEKTLLDSLAGLPLLRGVLGDFAPLIGAAHYFLKSEEK